MKTNEFPEDKNYKEIHKLHELLVTSAIPHTMKRLYDGWQIIYHYQKSYKKVCSVSEYFGSFGNDQDLLELHGLFTSQEKQAFIQSVGYLTAEEVFDRINSHYNRWPVCGIQVAELYYVLPPRTMGY